MVVKKSVNKMLRNCDNRYNFVTYNHNLYGPMRTMRCIVTSLLASLAVALMAQQAADDAPEWYLDEVVHNVFVVQNDFEYYYQPTAVEVRGHLEKGEAVYFLNSPQGLNSKKVRDKIDRLMASYDDIKAVTDWHMTSGTYWKEFRHERNRFRFSVKRKALEDGTYYVSVVENANYYKSLSKNKDKSKSTVSQKKSPASPKKSSTRRGRRPVTDAETEQAATDDLTTALAQVEDDMQDDPQDKPVMTEKQRRQEARKKQEEEKMAERARQRRAQEKRKEEAKAQKEAQKQLKAEEKRKKEEEKRLKREAEQREREQARLQARREKEAARRQAAAPKPVESRYHYSDVALWLSDKYDFLQTAAAEGSCTMHSTAVKDVEMAKLAIKNALKGSNARMAVPWRVNADTQAIETGYTVDDHVLVFALGKREDGLVDVTITEVSNEQFELFKQGLTE